MKISAKNEKWLEKSFAQKTADRYGQKIIVYLRENKSKAVKKLCAKNLDLNLVQAHRGVSSWTKNIISVFFPLSDIPEITNFFPDHGIPYFHYIVFIQCPQPYNMQYFSSICHNNLFLQTIYFNSSIKRVVFAYLINRNSAPY